MRVGVYLEAGYYKEGEKLFCEDIYTVLFNQLSQEKGISFSFLGRQYACKKENMYLLDRYDRFFELTPFRDLVDLCVRWPRLKRENKATFSAFVQNVDILLVMSPMPICIELVKLAGKYGKPVVLLARQDTRRVLPQRYGGIKKILATILAYLFEWQVERLVAKQDITVMALGSRIANRFSLFTDKVHYISTSPYRLSDIVLPESMLPVDWSRPIKLLFVGRVEVNKGFTELLECLSGEMPFDWRLTIVGDGAFMPEVKRLIGRYGIAEKVELMGFVPFGPDLMKQYRSHDIFVLPSYSEGLPQVVLEAMAGGCLVLASNVGGIPDVVNSGRTGLLFAPKSIDELRKAFIYVYRHQAEVESMRLEALNVARKYAFENQIEILGKALLTNKNKR